MLLVKNLISNKRGWIRIVEAFIAILLIAGVLLVVINQGYIGKRDISEQVYKVEIAILREVELDDGLRGDLLNLPEDIIPLEWQDFDDNGLDKVKKKIVDRTPDYLDCVAKICALDEICYGKGLPANKDIYSQSVAIVANLEKYSPRQLKMFCWTSG